MKGGCNMVNYTNGVKGDYLYNQVLPLIDYCGDIRRGNGNYSHRFSPNNIRRLILSPDGAMVFYHINTGAGLMKNVGFNPNFVYSCCIQPDHVPMLHVLSADRVCASIEEIVFCQRGMNNGTLGDNEFELTGLIKGYKGGSSDLKQVIMQRFKRLHAFIISPDDVKTFLGNTQDCNSSFKTLTSSEYVRGTCQVLLFNEQDWYKHYGSSAKYYDLDRQGSPLNNHFNKVMETIEKNKKAESLNNYKKERTKGISEEFDKEYKKAMNMLKALGKFLSMYKASEGCVFDVKIPIVKQVYLHPVDGYTFKTPILTEPKDANMSEADVYKYNITKLKGFCNNLYFELFEKAVTNLSVINQTYPTCKELILSLADGAIKPAPNFDAILEHLGCNFNGTRWNDSVANLFVLLSFECLNGNEGLDKEVWMKCLS